MFILMTNYDENISDNNKIFGINNRKGKDRKIKKPHNKYADCRSYTNRGKFRAYIRGLEINEDLILGSIIMRRRNWWDCEVPKPKLFL
jgi:hypothetical protein